MAIVAGVNIPDNQRLEIALTAIYGIGRTASKKIMEDSGMTESTRVRDLNDDELARVRSAVERTGLLIEGDLRRDVTLNIKRLMDLGCYRGLRHRRSLPLRGQRTKTNARTRKGPRKPIRK